MSLPESMSRIVIVGSKSHLDETVEALYKMGIVHLIDYTNDSDEGLTIGAPLPYSSQASERLLKIRAAEKDLNVNKKAEFDPVLLADIKAQISSGKVEVVEKDVFAAIEERNKIAQKITELEVKQKDLAVLEKLPLKLEDYSGYESLTVYVGTVRESPAEQLNAIPETEVFVSDDKKDRPSIAVFVSNANKDKVSNVLSEFGYVETPVPEEAGMPKDALVKAAEELVVNQEALVTSAQTIADLSAKYQTFIIASDEQLSDEVAKGETPLRIATSEYSYVIDAWVPTAETEKAKDEVKTMLGDGVYVEVQEERGRTAHESESAEPRFRTPPSKWKNGAVAKRYEYAISLVSVPKYNEIDPSFVVSLFFPIFFGFMVGDLAYAIPFIVLGAYGLRHAKSIEFQSIGTVLFYGGIWAAIFGTFFFGEMLGMHFVGEGTTLQHTWESLLGISLPEWFSQAMIHGHGVHKIGAVSDVVLLLKLSVYVGIVHLFVSYMLAAANAKIQHGAKEAFLEKGGWIFSLVGMSVFCWALTSYLFHMSTADITAPGILIPLLAGFGILVVGIVLNFPHEGAQAILELPGIVGNILSYTRLAAIGMSKAGMALAFNYIALIMLAPDFGAGVDVMSIVALIFSALVFVVGHLMIWVLAILSAGLHGLRLQYVESMNKFFVGGGVEYSPLKTSFKHIKSEKAKTEV